MEAYAFLDATGTTPSLQRIRFGDKRLFELGYSSYLIVTNQIYKVIASAWGYIHNKYSLPDDLGHTSVNDYGNIAYSHTSLGNVCR